MTTPPPAIPTPSRRADRAPGTNVPRATDDRFEQALQRHAADPADATDEPVRADHAMTRDEAPTHVDDRETDTVERQDDGDAAASADAPDAPDAPTHQTTSTTSTSAIVDPPSPATTMMARPQEVAPSTRVTTDTAVPATTTTVAPITSTPTGTVPADGASAAAEALPGAANGSAAAGTPTPVPSPAGAVTSDIVATTALPGSAEVTTATTIGSADAAAAAQATPAATGGASPAPSAPSTVAPSITGSGPVSDEADPAASAVDEVAKEIDVTTALTDEAAEVEPPDAGPASTTRPPTRLEVDGQLPRASTAPRIDVTTRAADPLAARLAPPEAAHADDLLAQAELRRVTASGRRLDVGIATHDLGTVRVEAVDRGTGLQLQLSSDQAGGRAQLGAHLAELRADLADRGVDVGSLDVGDAPADQRRRDEPSGRTGATATPTAEATDPHPRRERVPSLDGVDLRL